MASPSKDGGWQAALDELARLVAAAELNDQEVPGWVVGEMHSLSVRALRQRRSGYGFLLFESRAVFPLFELPDMLIAQTLSHMCAQDLAAFSQLGKSCSALVTVAASMRAERLGFSLPEPICGENAARALHFVQQMAAMQPYSIAAGSAHSLCTAPDGSLLSWGGDSVGDRRFLGHLGHGSLHGDMICTPTPVAGLKGVRVSGVAARGYACIVLTAAGEVWNWGWNEDGRLGHPSEAPAVGGSGYRHQSCPRLLAALRGTRVVQVACGERHGLALCASGALWSWGRASHGQLGWSGGQTSDGVHQSGRVLALATRRIIEVSAGGLHSLAVSDTGELFSWGAGRDGKLGHGDTQPQPVPKRVEALAGVVIEQASAGDGHSLVISSTGVLYSFGLGECGRLGLGDEETKHLPTRVPAGPPMRRASAGFYHSVVLSRGGEVFTFGDGAYGKLGHGNVDDQVVPTRVVALRDTPCTEVAAGYQHTAVRAASGAVYTSGIGWKGQLGQGQLEDPVDFYHSRVFKPISTYVGEEHLAASDGDVGNAAA